MYIVAATDRPSGCASGRFALRTDPGMEVVELEATSQRCLRRETRAETPGEHLQRGPSNSRCVL